MHQLAFQSGVKHKNRTIVTDLNNSYLENKKKEIQFYSTNVFKTWVARSGKNEFEMRF